MMGKRTWEEFRATGLLWFVNTILHLFGWAIAVEYDGGKEVRAFPVRSELRGFTEEINTDGYRKVTKYIKENADELVKETEEKTGEALDAQEKVKKGCYVPKLTEFGGLKDVEDMKRALGHGEENERR